MHLQVTIDARGVMKVAHLISMAGSFSSGGTTEAGGASQLSSFAAHAISQQVPMLLRIVLPCFLVKVVSLILFPAS